MESEQSLKVVRKLRGRDVEVDDEWWVGIKVGNLVRVGSGFHVWVAGPQKGEALPKWVKPGELKSIYFICTEMGGIWVVLETSFLVF